VRQGGLRIATKYVQSTRNTSPQRACGRDIIVVGSMGFAPADRSCGCDVDLAAPAAAQGKRSSVAVEEIMCRRG
jgi:hypothetical protein